MDMKKRDQALGSDSQATEDERQVRNQGSQLKNKKKKAKQDYVGVKVRRRRRSPPPRFTTTVGRRSSSSHASRSKPAWFVGG